MQLPHFKAAHLPPPRGRSPDPTWLEGTGRGRACYLIGGAGGLVESAALRQAEGEIVIGSNWTLRALVPSIWTVFDAAVWKSERGLLAGCPDSMACVVNKHCFGGGMYSTTHSKLLRMVGSGQRQLAEITVKKRGRGLRLPSGVFRAKVHLNYMPERLTQPLHPGGNSLCYQIQLAHLMGCDPIYAMAFTLQSGTPYHFGRTNPVTRRTAFYDAEVPMLWLSWYESQWPGRVRLLPGWSGPVYDVFKTEGLDEGSRLRALRGAGLGEDGSGPPEPDPGVPLWSVKAIA